MEEIEEEAKQLPLGDRKRTERINDDKKFQDWILSPASTKLWIHGNFSSPMLENPALSHFCTTLTKDLRPQRPQEPEEGPLCIVWFCGRHLGRDDDKSDSESSNPLGYDPNLGQDKQDAYSPGTKHGIIKRMMRSLISQLLCHYEFGLRFLLPPGVDLGVIEKGHSLSQLRRLFRWLVRQLPKEVTLFCLLDGIAFYEREEFEAPMLHALDDILELIVSDDVSAVVKVLVTSPRSTSTFRKGFDGKEILSMDSLTLSHVDV